jgi:hypothetical protein
MDCAMLRALLGNLHFKAFRPNDTGHGRSSTSLLPQLGGFINKLMDVQNWSTNFMEAS